MDPVNPKIIAVPDLEVPMIFDSPEEIAAREGIHERIQTEIYHGERERAFQAEEMLDTPSGWNEVEDLIMDDGDILVENMRPEKRRRDEIARGRRNRGRKTTSVTRNENIPLLRLGGRKILRNSIPRIEMKINKRMNCRYQSNSRRSLRCCFATES